MAGVSRRTIDYYTKLGLLKPLRSESQYRYYTVESLLRLRIIEGMKKQRYTLEEIKQRIDILDSGSLPAEANNKGTLDVNFLKDQFKMLEGQLAQLQPLLNNSDTNQTTLVTRQALMKSMSIIQTLIVYINEAAPFI